MRFPPPTPFVLATYKSGDGKSVVVCVSDMPLATAAGATLTIIPPAVAQESARAGRLDETLSENLHEVFNLISSLFNHPNHPHLVLSEVVMRATALSSVLEAPMRTPRERADFEISISGYSSGKFSSWAIELS